MSLPCESLSIEIELLRPVRSGPARDVTSQTTLESAVPAMIDHRERVQTDTDGTQYVISATFWIDLCDSDGVARDVKKDDWVQWTNYRNRLLREERIHEVIPVYIGTRIDHLRLVVTGG